MKKISNYIVKYWYAYVLAITCMILSVSLDMLTPRITGSFIDDVIVKGNMKLFNKLIIITLCIGLGRCIFQYVKEYTFDRISSKISLNIRRDLFQYLQGLSINFFDKNNTGELMARVKDDVDRIWDGLGFVGMLIIEVIIHTSIVLFCMFNISKKLFIIPCIAMPLVGFLAIIMERKLDKIYEAISEENVNEYKEKIQNLSHIKTFKKIIKRDGKIVDFNLDKITDAIRKAGVTTGEFNADKAKELGDDEANDIDMDFVEALEYGMIDKILTKN